MTDNRTIDALLDALAEPVAAKVRAELGQAGGMKAVCSKRKSDYL